MTLTPPLWRRVLLGGIEIALVLIILALLAVMWIPIIVGATPGVIHRG